MSTSATIVYVILLNIGFLTGVVLMISAVYTIARERTNYGRKITAAAAGLVLIIIATGLLVDAATL